MSARFQVMRSRTFPEPGHYPITAFNVAGEGELLTALEQQLPRLDQDTTVVAVNDEALELVLRLSLEQPR